MIKTARLSRTINAIIRLSLPAGVLALVTVGCGGAPLEDDPTAGVWAEGGEAPPAFVFMSERTGQGDLYVMDISGSRIRRLTFAPEPDFGPRWAAGPELLEAELIEVLEIVHIREERIPAHAHVHRQVPGHPS